MSMSVPEHWPEKVRYAIELDELVARLCTVRDDSRVAEGIICFRQKENDPEADGIMKQIKAHPGYEEWMADNEVQHQWVEDLVAKRRAEQAAGA